MRKMLAYLIFSLFFVVGIADATVVTGLNVATVPVKNTARSVREDALPKAFGQVLVKLSGNPTVATVPAVQDAMDDINSYIQSYGYTNQESLDGDTQLLLQVTFDQKAVKQLLRQAGQADWSSNRPLTLLWVQIPDSGNTTILSNTTDAQLVQQVQAAAKMRGVPVLLPAMDLQDQSFVNNDTDSFNQTLLKQASARYGSAAVLAGDIEQDGDQWQGRWLLLLNDTPYQWRNKADTQGGLIRLAINDMVNLMANQLAVTDTKALQTSVTIDVSNVQNLDDYAKVLQAVRHLSPVAGVSIKDMDGSDLLLSVKIVGGEQALADALTSEPRFTSLDNTDSANTRADLFYRWQGEGEQTSG